MHSGTGLNGHSLNRAKTDYHTKNSHSDNRNYTWNLGHGYLGTMGHFMYSCA